MIEKTYYVGQFNAGCPFAGAYFLGIHRSGEGTLPLTEATANRVKNNFSSRYMKSFDILRGYLCAVIGELALEGTDDTCFKVRTRNWDDGAETLFGEYLRALPEFARNILPLDQGQAKDLDFIVCLHLE